MYLYYDKTYCVKEQKKENLKSAVGLNEKAQGACKTKQNIQTKLTPIQTNENRSTWLAETQLNWIT